MDAEAKVSLNAEGFESGAARVSRANKQMTSDSEAAATKISRSFRSMEESSNGARRMSGNMGELAHSGRAVVEMLAAGQGAMRSLQVETPRLVQALGGGVGAIIGVGAAAAGLEKVASAAIGANQALKDATSTRTGFINSKNAGPEVYMRQLDALFEKGKQIDAASESFAARYGERLADIGTTALDAAGKFFNPRGGRLSQSLGIDFSADKAQTDRDAEKAANQKAAVELSGQLAEHQRKVNDLADEGARIGERAVRVRQLELERLEKIDALRRAGSEKGFDERPLLAQLNREYELKKKTAELDAAAYQREIALRLQLVNIREGATQGPGSTSIRRSVILQPGDEQRYAGVSSYAALRAQAQKAMDDFNALSKSGRNTDEAGAKVRETSYAARQELERLSQRGQEMEKQTRIQALLLSGQTTEANYASALLNIDNQRTTAADARNGYLVKQLDTQKQQLEAAQALERFEHPERVEADRRKGLDSERRMNRMVVDAGLTRVTRDSNGVPLGGFDNSARAYRDTTPQERTDSLAARQHRSLYDGSTKAVNARGSGLIPDVASIPDHVPLPDVVGYGRLSDYEARNGRSQSSMRMRDLLSPAQRWNALPHGLDIIRPKRRDDDAGAMSLRDIGNAAAMFGVGQSAAALGRGVAEQNRPNAPQDAGQQAMVGALSAMQSSLAAIQQSISGLSSKFSVA
ncbi:MAG: hypothetical protein INR62_04150 [Rhodospirillales bacterium]|nr:hypothetical protein [Acetobacter sp.]